MEKSTAPSQMSFDFGIDFGLFASEPAPAEAQPDIEKQRLEPSDDKMEAPNDDVSAAGESGLNAWRDEHLARLRKLAARTGLPLEHPVELTLRSGPVARGQLRLAVNSLWIEAEHLEQIVFEVDGVTFRIREMESCVRMD